MSEEEIAHFRLFSQSNRDVTPYSGYVFSNINESGKPS
jgi:hypothetical protein